MKKLIQLSLVTFLLLATSVDAFAQETVAKDVDFELKETLYKKYKREVQSYAKDDFDALFFDFFKKQRDESLTFSKEEFYTYTIKIAIYSEKLGLLYKDQKADAQKTKKEWFEKNYLDYLNSKK